MDHVERRLREAARAHQPDRARILARVERGMTDTPAVEPPARHRPFTAPWLRVAAATAAVAGVLAVGGFVVGGVLRDEPPATTAGPAPTDAPRTPVAPPSGSSAPTAPPATEGVSRPQDGFLRGEGAVDPHSNRWWAQSNITFTTGAPLKALTVELRVALTGGIGDTGNWRSLPADDFTVAVRADGDALVYTWTLKPGRTAPAGRHVFAGQYNHAEGGRDARGDRYTVTATATDGKRARVGGGF
ncbi:hypothetical protein [Streptomyces sp. NPDC047886]|uniref:hypothetical protein n=1 Tax=Streptomyces sp. NPDC047886 TaxID=3365490 RepID=UPI0037238D7C